MTKHPKLYHALLDFWLSEKEASIYLTILEIGSWAASTIARITSIKRVTTYAIIQDMKRKWMIKEITKEGTKIFSVVEPQHLLWEKKKKFTEFESLIPEFSAISDTFWNRPTTEYYEWLEWLKKYYDKQIEPWKDIYAFLDLSPINKGLLEYLDHVHVPQRIQKWIHAKVIIPYKEENKEYVWVEKKSLRETIMVEHPLFTMATEIDLFWDDMVGFAMFSKDEMSATIIKSNKLYMSLKSIFNVFWELYANNDSKT